MSTLSFNKEFSQAVILVVAKAVPATAAMLFITYHVLPFGDSIYRIATALMLAGTVYAVIAVALWTRSGVEEWFKKAPDSNRHAYAGIGWGAIGAVLFTIGTVLLY